MGDAVAALPGGTRDDDYPSGASLDREIGRLESRVEALEVAVDRLEVSLSRLVRIVDFAGQGMKIVWGAVSLIGADGLLRLMQVIFHITGGHQ